MVPKQIPPANCFSPKSSLGWGLAPHSVKKRKQNASNTIFVIAESYAIITGVHAVFDMSDDGNSETIE